MEASIHAVHCCATFRISFGSESSSDFQASWRSSQDHLHDNNPLSLRTQEDSGRALHWNYFEPAGASWTCSFSSSQLHVSMHTPGGVCCGECCVGRFAAKALEALVHRLCRDFARTDRHQTWSCSVGHRKWLAPAQ